MAKSPVPVLPSFSNPISPALYELANATISEITNYSRPTPQHGNDRLLSNDGAASHIASPKHAQIRSGRQEAGAVCGAETGQEIVTLYIQREN
ncbi:uncharacterized protein Z518_07564 [Rhinocladiella mackenziei CBS 650.93]|uniref:Uncharacterized protein n=1 Tax=Rhinocladiella mackenziei CBS 650.93 TaxID=1442369 RepID=A0A0D2ILF6_9EURO|nr:uncharacterized protein Z518_07564 [Rhinocladiella mackenziei CBS 650.93]KIX04011.1 hypothetical protein Z518_07564 [Rhinocladiella mackenziei CBS 650.93]